MYHHRNITQCSNLSCDFCFSRANPPRFPDMLETRWPGLWLAEIGQLWPLIGPWQTRWPRSKQPDPPEARPEPWPDLELPGNLVSGDYPEISLCQNIIGTWWDLEAVRAMNKTNETSIPTSLHHEKWIRLSYAESPPILSSIDRQVSVPDLPGIAGLGVRYLRTGHHHCRHRHHC